MIKVETSKKVTAKGAQIVIVKVGDKEIEIDLPIIDNNIEAVKRLKHRVDIALNVLIKQLGG